MYLLTPNLLIIQFTKFLDDEVILVDSNSWFLYVVVVVVVVVDFSVQTFHEFHFVKQLKCPIDYFFSL